MEIAKVIVGKYLRIDPSQVRGDTVIDKSAVNGSIMVHRMYGSLANEGIVVKDYLTIKTFSELLAKITPQQQGEIESDIDIKEEVLTPGQAGVGIDIENIANMPVCTDYREDQFYVLNFTPQEIAYCSIQSNPRSSFAGLFAAKEAIVKANPLYKNRHFNSIQINHHPEGKPYLDGMHVSISHIDAIAIAVAVMQSEAGLANDSGKTEELNNLLVQQNRTLQSQLTWLKGLAVLLLATTILLIFIFIMN